jgi:hypothetical protein
MSMIDGCPLSELSSVTFGTFIADVFEPIIHATNTNYPPRKIITFSVDCVLQLQDPLKDITSHPFLLTDPVKWV